MLDVACGTGFLVGLDDSERMLEIARARLPQAEFVRRDVLSLPFPDDSFDRVLTGRFYGHLDERERLTFLAEARRVAPELVVVDSALRDEVSPVEVQKRALDDGSRWEVLKRYFTRETLVNELGGGEVLFADAGSSPCGRSCGSLVATVRPVAPRASRRRLAHRPRPPAPG